METALFKNLEPEEKFTLSKDSTVVLVKLPAPLYAEDVLNKTGEPFTAKFIKSGSPARIPDDGKVFKLI